MSVSDNPVLAAALAYAAAGIPIFPCEPSTKQPIGTLVPPNRDIRGRGYAKGTGGFKKATRDPAVIEEWFGMRPDAMIGIPTGAASGVFVIDLDTPKQVKRGPIGELTPDGIEGWRKAGIDCKTFEVATGSGGKHIYFRYDPQRPITNKEGSLKGKGINVRGDGGYVVVPPSRTCMGGQYRPANGLAMGDAAAAPDALYKLLGAKRAGKEKPQRTKAAEPAAAPDADGQKFGVIFADPPWDFKSWSEKGTGRNAEQHYDTMDFDALKDLPVVDWAAKDCALIMWIIGTHANKAIELAEAWGFRFVKIDQFVWTKLNPKAGTPVTGMGYHTRGSTEQCLLAVRGSPKALRHDIRALLEMDCSESVRLSRGAHSWKPPEFYDRAAQLYAGPYLEMFARQSRPGWIAWGNETTKFDGEPAGSAVFNDAALPEFDNTDENAELLRAALPCIPADDREIWVKVLAALKTLEPVWGKRARAIADWWSKSSSKYDIDGQDKAWDSLEADKPDGITVLTLFYLAREYGWVDPRRVSGGAEQARKSDEEDVPEADEALKVNSFIRGDAGQILRNHPQNTRFAVHGLGVQLRLNEFSTQTEIGGLPGFDGELTDAGAIRLRFLVHEAFGFMPPAELFREVLIDIAHSHRFHPVRDYLGRLIWDATPRIDTWLTRYAGAEDTPFNRAVGRLFLIAGVRRIRRPGIKFDTMPILESPQQGKNKSQALRLIAIKEEWFTDNLPLGADPKEVIEQISGNWIIEFPELSGMATRERERITAFLSRQVDKARPAYGHRRESVPRQFVACGTTNDDEYLPRDERRMWPVRINLFDLKALACDVDQLWAEAAHHEASGAAITLDEALWPEAAMVRAARMFENPYQSILAEHIDGEMVVMAKRVRSILDIQPDRMRYEAKRMGLAMIALGYDRRQARCDDEPNKGCKRGDYYYELVRA